MRPLNPFILSGYAGLMLILIGLNAAFILENVSTATGGELMSSIIAIGVYILILSALCVTISKKSVKKQY